MSFVIFKRRGRDLPIARDAGAMRLKGRGPVPLRSGEEYAAQGGRFGRRVEDIRPSEKGSKPRF